MQHYTEVKDWSDVRYNRNLSAVGGNQLWESGQDKTQGTQAQPYKLGTLQESALPHLYSESMTQTPLLWQHTSIINEQDVHQTSTADFLCGPACRHMFGVNATSIQGNPVCLYISTPYHILMPQCINDPCVH